MNLNRLNNDLQQLRRFRNRTDANLSVGASARGLYSEIQRRSKSASGTRESFDLVVPPHLAQLCEIVTLARGILTIRTADAATRYQLERFLRSGGEAELARCARASIRRIKLL